MKKFFYKTISKIILSLIYTQNISANINNQYEQNKTTYFQEQKKINKYDNKIYIKSNKIKIHQKNKIEFTGNVEIIQKNNTLFADKMTLETTKKNNNNTIINKITIQNNINYLNNYINITGKNGYGYACLNNKSIDIFGSKYKLTKKNLHGDAYKIMQRKNGLYTIIENGSITSCPLKKQHYCWEIVAADMLYNHHTDNIELWNTLLKIKNIPIYYKPYLATNIHNIKNSSNIITPVFKLNNKNRIELIFPYYFNLIPNYKIKIQPKYTINKYANINTTIKYPTVKGKGKIENTIIKINKSDNEIIKKHDYYIWYLNWNHKGYIQPHWKLYTDLTKFNQYNNNCIFNLNYLDSYHKYIKQKVFIVFNNKYWNNNIIYKDFYFFDNNVNNTYGLTPQLNIHYAKTNNKQKIFYTIFGQITKFKNNNNTYPKTTRIHIEPTITFFTKNKWHNTSYIEGKIKNTKYIQNNIKTFNQKNNITLKKNIYRIIPQIKFNHKQTIKNNILNKKSYNNIIEPQIQYLYIPHYKKQNNIGIYDTYKLDQNDYNTIYRDCIYSGLDKVLYANKLTCSITNKIYNKKKMKYLVHQ